MHDRHSNCFVQIQILQDHPCLAHIKLSDVAFPLLYIILRVSTNLQMH